MHQIYNQEPNVLRSYVFVLEHKREPILVIKPSQEHKPTFHNKEETLEHRNNLIF